ncbi:NUDIX hydrolase [Lysinibacillus sp. HST-98]|uniref:NUDIX hydrolase n=1 Tax=Lysinibacillus TaxID=400634 RepID=UPI0001DA4C37|nr:MULTISPECIES: NUDIX domain-containing protein [Lysinibacillus]EFI66566.1 mutT/nudix family protein [Lysinibacillus fusiformis ZC1]EKU43802.1 mutT/nudix family protein [Lysinibacillus fusiformis ZB2]MBL3729380.1 NUDIX hydrolase [Lysinibacillus sp. HST-98]MED4697748.1 NUDIX hydrolase [Lysinibacillus capsici]
MKWLGAAAICLNESNQLLMVLQGTVDEEKTWTVPSGGKEATEDFKTCCIREVYEETGYTVDIIKEIYYKDNEVVEVRYFQTILTGGQMMIHDPDELIYDIAWKSKEEVALLPLTFPEDRVFLLSLFK